MTPTDKDLEAAKRFDQEYFGSMCEGDEFAKALAQFLTDYTAAKDTLIAELTESAASFERACHSKLKRAESAEAALAAMKNERDEAMNAGYAQGVENAEACASKRIHQLEALDPIRALLDQGKDALIESLKADLAAMSDEEER